MAVDGKTVAHDVQTTNVVGPIAVSSGTRTLTFTDSDGEVVAENTLDARAGSSSDLVLHLTTAAGDPPSSRSSPNDLTGVPSDKASLTVAHTAAVPPADIRVDGKVLFANVANGESLNLVVPAGSYSVDIVPAGESSPVVFGPVNLTVQGGSLNRVYAVGDPAAKTMNVAVHVITLPESGSAQPTMVNTGTGGIAVVVPIDRPHPAPVARLSRPIPAAVRRRSTALVILLWAGAACSASPAPLMPAASAISRGTPPSADASQPSRPSRPAVVTPTETTPATSTTPSPIRQGTVADSARVRFVPRHIELPSGDSATGRSGTDRERRPPGTRRYPERRLVGRQRIRR